MTDAVEIALIVSVAPTLVGVGGIILGLMNLSKSKDIKQNTDGILSSAVGKKDKAEAALANYKDGVADVRSREP